MRLLRTRARLHPRRGRFRSRRLIMYRSRRPRVSILDLQPGESNGMPRAHSTPRILRRSERTQTQGHRQSSAAALQKAEKLEQQKERRKSKRLSQQYRRVTREQKKRVYNKVIVISDDEDDDVKRSAPKKPTPKFSQKMASLQPISSDDDDFQSPAPSPAPSPSTKRKLPFTTAVSTPKKPRSSPKNDTKEDTSNIVATKVASNWISKKTKGISYKRKEAIERGLQGDEIEEVKTKRKPQKKQPVLKLTNIPIKNFEVGGALRSGEPSASKSRIANQKARSKKATTSSKSKRGPITLIGLSKPSGTRRASMPLRQAQIGGCDKKKPASSSLRTPISNRFSSNSSRSKHPVGSPSMNVKANSQKRLRRKTGDSDTLGDGQNVSDADNPLVPEVNDSSNSESGSESSGEEIEIENERLQKLTAKEVEMFTRLTKKSVSTLQTVKVACAGITLRNEDLRTLVGRRWLNDEIINSFVSLINERNKDHFKEHSTPHAKMEYEGSNSDENVTQLFLRPRPRTHVFNSFFMTRLECGENGYDYSGVRRWLKKSKFGIKDLDLIMCPVNLDNIHWVLAAIDVRAKEFLYLDSMGGSNSNVLEILRRWYADELKDKCGEEMDIEEWEDVYNPGYLPTQKDQGSCGAFVLYTADYLELGKEPDFTQSDMNVLRKRTALFLKRNRLADHPTAIEDEKSEQDE